METRIEILSPEKIDDELLNQIRVWADEVLKKVELKSQPPYLCITVWKTMEKFRTFSMREKEMLGVVTGEETDFLATHDAWRGYPRIHVCQERLKGIPSAILQGVIHHEIGHALKHGSLEFYTFRFSGILQEVGRASGLDLPLLQQCVYLFSIAIKDQEVVKWLSQIGLSFNQIALLNHLISDTEEEKTTWEFIQDSPALRKIAFSTFLKTLLPIEAMIAIGIEDAKTLKDQWNEAYGWLFEKEREGLSLFSQFIMNLEGKTFQERLEQAVLRLITDPYL